MTANSELDELQNLIHGAFERNEHEPFFSAVHHLVRRHVANAVTDVAARDDIIQEIQLAAFQRLEVISKAKEPRHYILAIAANKCLQYRRSHARGINKRTQVNSEVLMAVESPMNGVTPDETREQVRRFLDSLPPDLETIAWSRFGEENTLEQISERTMMTVDMVRTRLKRIEQAFRTWRVEQRKSKQ